MLRIELKDDEVSAALARMVAAMTDMTESMEEWLEGVAKGGGI